MDLYEMNCFEGFVEEHSDWEWDMRILSHNPSIGLRFIEKHINWKWNITELSWNPSPTLRFIEKHLDWEWDIHGLPENKFTFMIGRENYMNDV